MVFLGYPTGVSSALQHISLHENKKALSPFYQKKIFDKKLMQEMDRLYFRVTTILLQIQKFLKPNFLFTINVFPLKSAPRRLFHVEA